MVLNRLMGQLQGIAQAGKPGKPVFAGKPGYPRTLKVSDFFSGTLSVKTGTWETVGSKKVGAQQFMELGQGSPQLDPMEQGRPQITLKDDATTPATMVGTIRLIHESAQGTISKKIVEEDSTEFNTSTKSERLVMPRARTKGYDPVKEDSKIFIKVNLSDNGSGTLSASNSTMIIPITVYE